MTDDSLMPFGVHKGKALANVPAHYLIYIFEQGYRMSDELRAYIRDNMDVLKNESQKNKSR